MMQSDCIADKLLIKRKILFIYHLLSTDNFFTATQIMAPQNSDSLRSAAVARDRESR